VIKKLFKFLVDSNLADGAFRALVHPA
jgi:hypothetical protein